MPEIQIPGWLGLTVIAAIVSTIGSLFGMVLKDYFFARSFEEWKQGRALDQIYQKYRDPLLLAARELASRLVTILQDYPTGFLTETVLKSRPTKQKQNSADDPYVQRYMLLSTAYRVCAFLGWLELYRQEITFLKSGESQPVEALAIAVSRIREDFAEGDLNRADDWHRWKDILIFREELRAIGESMIETRGTVRTVMGYGHFCEVLETSTSGSLHGWTSVVMNFLLDHKGQEKDFWPTRLKRLVAHLVELIQLLDKPGNPLLGEKLAAAYKTFAPTTSAFEDQASS